MEVPQPGGHKAKETRTQTASESVGLHYLSQRNRAASHVQDFDQKKKINSSLVTLLSRKAAGPVRDRPGLFGKKVGVDG